MQADRLEELCAHKRVERYKDGRRPTCRDCGRPWAETQRELSQRVLDSERAARAAALEKRMQADRLKVPRMTVDEETGAVYLYLVNGEHARTVEVGEGLNLDVAESGEVLGVEWLPLAFISEDPSDAG